MLCTGSSMTHQSAKLIWNCWELWLDSLKTVLCQFSLLMSVQNSMWLKAWPTSKSCFSDKNTKFLKSQNPVNYIISTASVIWMLFVALFFPLIAKMGMRIKDYTIFVFYSFWISRKTDTRFCIIAEFPAFFFFFPVHFLKQTSLTSKRLVLGKYSPCPICPIIGILMLFL